MQEQKMRGLPDREIECADCEKEVTAKGTRQVRCTKCQKEFIRRKARKGFSKEKEKEIKHHFYVLIKDGLTWDEGAFRKGTKFSNGEMRECLKYKSFAIGTQFKYQNNIWQVAETEDRHILKKIIMKEKQHVG